MPGFEARKICFFPEFARGNFPHMSESKKLRVAVVGASGYTGEELCRLLLLHPRLELVALTSRQHAGKSLASILPKLRGIPGANDLHFVEPDLDVLLAGDLGACFLSLPHGIAAEFAVPLVEAGIRVLDISADFRLRDPEVYREFYEHVHPAPELLPGSVYGLPEVYRGKLPGASLIASPGCYPTSILLPLIPLLREGLIQPEGICVSSASGVSGAGRKLDPSFLYAECNESLKAYGLPKHRHLSEIEQELSLAASSEIRLAFVPHLAPMTRGIHTTIFARPRDHVSETVLLSAWERAYAGESFVRFGSGCPDTKNVTGTNFCDLGLKFDSRTGTVILLSCIDNLIKGAGGQAIQSLNLCQGWPETMGLL